MLQQGSLLKEHAVFTSFDENDMNECNAKMKAWAHGPQPLKLLFIIDKMSRIGK